MIMVHLVRDVNVIEKTSRPNSNSCDFCHEYFVVYNQFFIFILICPKLFADEDHVATVVTDKLKDSERWM